MEVTNDNSCSWINDLNPRTNIKSLSSHDECDWLIIGAGYTGLSAARKLAQINSNLKIILADAQLAGEGASGRNSGYLVDTTLNDGFTSNKELQNYKKKADIYSLGIDVVKKFIKEHQVDCDWNESGKYFASSKIEDKKILNNFSKTLSKLGFEHRLLRNKELSEQLGTSFYNIGLYTKGGILLHPGKLVRAMIEALPSNVILYGNSSLLNWSINKDLISSTLEFVLISFLIDSFKIKLGQRLFIKSIVLKYVNPNAICIAPFFEANASWYCPLGM